MVFVTVGTHEQQFNRLVEYMDHWAEKHKEEVIIQTGFSTYEPKNCRWQSWFPYQEMSELMKEARIVITHGGPSSFIAPMQMGKTPIVVPREKKYGEHVNDHQVNFCREVAKRYSSILEVEDMEKLAEDLDRYDELVKEMDRGCGSNNAAFCKNLEEIVNKTMERDMLP